MPNNTNRKNRAKRFVTRNELNILSHGIKFNPPSHPKVKTISPWWAAVVAVGGSSDATITANHIANTFRDQFGLYKTDATHRIDIALRVIRMSMYSLTAGRPISVCCHGIASSDFNTVLEDWPAQVQLARVGYQWPLADQTHVLDDASTKVVLKVDVRKEALWLGYLHILWRPTVQSPITYSDLIDGDGLSTFSLVDA